MPLGEVESALADVVVADRELRSARRLADAQPLRRHEPELSDQDAGESVSSVRVRSRRSGCD